MEFKSILKLSLKDFDNGFVHTINFLPENYAFFKLTKIRNYSHFKFGKQILETIGIKKFDLIIDATNASK